VTDDLATCSVLKYVAESLPLERRNVGRVAGELGLMGLFKLLGLFPGLGVLSVLTEFNSGNGTRLLGVPCGPLSLSLQSERIAGRGE
jgi:hypothetical protein